MTPPPANFFPLPSDVCFHYYRESVLCKATSAWTVSPLHKNEFSSEKVLVGPIVRKSNKVSLDIQLTQFAI